MRSGEIAKGEAAAIARMGAALFGIVGTCEFVSKGVNETFRFESGGRSYSLRVHNPAYHNLDALRSERIWLNALADEADVIVPTPHRTRDGDWVATVESPATGEARHCTLSDWIEGIQRRANPEPAHFRALGETMARLHEHASVWSPPADFNRPVWDVGGVYWERTQGGGALERALDAMNRSQADMISRAKEKAEQVFLELRDIKDAWGLIHADLHLGNILFQSGKACPIDFDDSGFGSHIYDAAAAVHFHSASPHFRSFLFALIEGYQRIRRFPEEGLSLLKAAIAIRSASVAIWIASQAEYNERFRENQDEYLATQLAFVQLFLEASSIYEDL
ncbi:MAG: phosphotransferase [Fimbriimonadales bacterium]|nr:phosphotransferase [Fimbriimonadales bacterium]